jgi:hypothetical protein
MPGPEESAGESFRHEGWVATHLRAQQSVTRADADGLGALGELVVEDNAPYATFLAGPRMGRSAASSLSRTPRIPSRPRELRLRDGRA